MARPPLPVGSWGKISRKQYGPGQWVAYARFRDHDGETRQMERAGTTGAKAETALKEALVARLRVDHDEIGADTRVAAAASTWFNDEVFGHKAENTEIAYRHAIEKIITPGIGELRLREVTVARMDRFLKAVVASRGPSAAKVAKSALSGVFGMSARLGAMPRNPLRDVAPIKVEHAEVIVLELDQLIDLRIGMHAHALAQQRDLVDVFDFLIGTGDRIGEALAVRWFDLDLESDRATVVTRATIVRGRIQEKPKSESSRRRLTLPGWLVEQLLKRRAVQEQIGRPNPLGLVFPSERGRPRDPSNVRKVWREVRDDLGYEWVTPHHFRKSVATLIDEAGASATSQLGHADERTTRRHYIPRTNEGPDVRDVLAGLDLPADSQRFAVTDRAPRSPSAGLGEARKPRSAAG